MSKMKCECGRSFENQSGFTLHKKKCTFKPAKTQLKQPTQEHKPQPLANHNGNGKDPVSVQERREIQRLILRRQDVILKALVEELDGKPESIAERLRAERNVTLSVPQLKDLIEKIDEQITEETEPHLEDEKEKLSIKKADLDDEYGKLEREMKERHRKEFRELCEKKAAEKLKINEEIRAAERKVIMEKAAHLITKKQELQTQLISTEKAEAEVQALLTNQVSVIKKHRGRIESLVREAANTALEELIVVTDREHAHSLIKKIPTLTETINLIQSKDGLNEFMRMLNPNIKALPYIPQAGTVIDMKAAVASIVTEDDDDEESVDSKLEDHENEVYERQGRRR